MLEQEIEISREPASAMAEKIAIRRIGNIVVHLLRIEMVCQVESTDRDSN